MNITSQDLISIYNKAKLIGTESYLVNLKEHGWYRKNKSACEGGMDACEPFLLILHQDNDLSFYIPNDVERDFESDNLYRILSSTELSVLMNNTFNKICVLGKCPIDANYLFSKFNADEMK